MRRMSRKTIAVAAAAAVVLAGGGIAFAYWTAGGSGTGTAATGTNAPIVAVQTTTVSDMAPGDSAQPLSGNFNNDNPGPVYVSTVTASIASVDKAPGAPAGTCTASDYTLATPIATVNAEVPTGDGVGSWSGATIKFNNKPLVNQDACKGATVNLNYVIA